MASWSLQQDDHKENRKVEKTKKLEEKEGMKSRKIIIGIIKNHYFQENKCSVYLNMGRKINKTLK